MKLDKHGKYRFNMYLNPNVEKDRVIIEYLEQRYSAPDFIKETLYSMANGSMINTSLMNNNRMQQQQEAAAEVAAAAEVYEPIQGADDIEI